MKNKVIDSKRMDDHAYQLLIEIVCSLTKENNSKKFSIDGAIHSNL